MLRKLKCLLIVTAMGTAAGMYPSSAKSVTPMPQEKATPVSAISKRCAGYETPLGKRLLFPKTRRRAVSQFHQAVTSKRKPVGANTERIFWSREVLPEFIGACLYSDTWTDNDNIGVYRIPTSPMRGFEFIAPGEYADYGAVAKDGIYYSTTWQDLWGLATYTSVKGVNLSTGEEVYSYMVDEQNIDVLSMAMALHPQENVIYAINYHEDEEGELTARLVTVDYGETGTEPVITPVVNLAAQNWCAMAIDGQGKFYAIAKVVDEDEMTIDSSLYSIDPATGEASLIGSTGQLPEYASGATIDTSTGRMFWTVNPDDFTGFLTEVDLTTGEATPVYSFPDNEEVNGLTVVPPIAESKAPSTLEAFDIETEPNSRTCTAIIVAPEYLYDGSDPEDETLTVIIKANEVMVAELENLNYGEESSVTFTFASSGVYEFAAYATNEAGKGPESFIRNLFVGTDTPKSPAPVLEYADGIMNLTWNPVTKTLNGDELTEEQVSYTVKRLPDDIEVANGLKGTSFSEMIMVPEGELVTYSYTVEAISDDAHSEAGESNPVSIGILNPPYQFNFRENGIPGFTVIDANEDGHTWKPFENGVRIDQNSQNEADDWLITPALRLKGGKSTHISFDTWCSSSSFPERLEVKWGKGNTVADMTQRLWGPEDITGSIENIVNVSESIVPEEDGVYYIGFHGISDKDMLFLTIDNLFISGGVALAAPSAVTELTAMPGEDGAPYATLSFKAPVLDISGVELSSIDKVEVLENAQLKATCENLEPGHDYSIKVEEPVNGNHTYTVIAYNEQGAGVPANVSVFVGVDCPGALSSATIERTQVEGEVKVSWLPVTTDIQGNHLTESQVRYNVYTVYGNNQTLVGENIEGSSYTFKGVEENYQNFIQCLVEPFTAQGKGEGAYTPMIPVGTPYMGLEESFASGKLSYIWLIDQAGGGTWTIAKDNSFTGITSSDADNGYVAMTVNRLDQFGSLSSGIISLEGINNPTLSFNLFNASSENGTRNPNIVTVHVDQLDGTDPVELLSAPVEELCNKQTGWQKVCRSLEQFAGKNIIVTLTTACKGFAMTALDRIVIGSTFDRDLCMLSLDAPVEGVCGKEYSVTATVLNEGFADAKDFNVELYVNGEVSSSRSVAGPLACGESASVEFSVKMPDIESEYIDCHAGVSCSGDENHDNDFTQVVRINTLPSRLPSPSALTASLGDGSVDLSWTAPDAGLIEGRQSVEDFEDGTGFEAVYKDWIFVDGDQFPVGGVQNVSIPGITPGETTGSFWIWDQNGVVPREESFNAHGGDKYIFSIYRADDGEADDWAISPELDGKSQYISFYAKSYSSSYKEKVEIYYSTGGISPEDFIKIEGAGGVVPGVWTAMGAELPAGAKRFAVRSCAAGAFILMLDDFCFAGVGAPDEAHLIGYDVYRNGVRINDSTVSEETYQDSTVEDNQEYAYAVLAVYDNGVSPLSDHVSIRTSDICAPYIDGISVHGGRGHILVNGADGRNVVVSALNGMVVRDMTAVRRTAVSLLPGIYIVKIDDMAWKVTVR